MTRHGDPLGRFPHRFTPWLLLAAGETIAIGFLAVPDAREHLVPYLLVFWAGSLLSLFAARSLSASGTTFLLLCGGLFRATLLARQPDLSDDLYRYLWDGRVAAAGISPYAEPPASPKLARIDPALNARVAHPQIRTVYPPVAQAVFRIAGETPAGEFLFLKAFFAAADLSIVALLAASAPAGELGAAALYAFHPLAVSESAGQGHIDSLGVALLLAALLWLTGRRPVRAGVAFALSALTKYVSAAAVLPFLRRGGARFFAAFAIAAASVWGLAAIPGASPAGGLSEYATRWEANSLLYPAAVEFMESTRLPERAKDQFLILKERLHHPDWTQTVFPFFYAAFFARAFLALLLCGALVVIAWRARTPEGGTFASLAALLLVSPTLHPWYLLWVLPFAAARREPAFLFLSFSIPVSYALMYPAPGWTRGRVMAAEYVPFVLIAGWSLATRSRRAVGERLAA